MKTAFFILISFVLSTSLYSQQFENDQLTGDEQANIQRD